MDHIPVLLDEVVDFARNCFVEDALAFDGTLGGGGYTRKLASLGYHVHASDLDTDALERFKRNSSEDTITLYHGNFSEVIGEFEDSSFTFITADLGYSSIQLDILEKGFSYLADNQLLDLRYNETQGIPAHEYILTHSEEEVRNCIYQHSGEKYAGLCARVLKAEIEKGNTQTHQIREAILTTLPKKERKQYGVLSRVWQALRIEVNNEFEHLTTFINTSLEKLKPGGILAIVAFHSLEDKIITKRFREVAKPIEIDSFGNTQKNFTLLTKKAITASEDEIERNIRSRSGLLRSIQKNLTE